MLTWGQPPTEMTHISMHVYVPGCATIDYDR